MKIVNKVLSRLSTQTLAIKTIFYILYKKCICDGSIILKGRNIIQKGFKLELKNEGDFYMGKATYARRYLSIIVEGGICTIGDNCFFNQNCSITCLNKITIEDKCTFGNNLVIVDHDHDLNHRGRFIKGSVFVGENTWVGANVTILKDSHIGRNCIVGAGAVVKGYVPDNTILIQKRNNLTYSKI